MSFRKKRSNPAKAEAVAIPRAKPLRHLPAPTPAPQKTPDPRTTPARGWPIRPDTERTVRTPILGEPVPLFDPTLRVPDDGYVDVRELRQRLQGTISDTNGNRQMLEMWQERHGGSLGDAMQALHGGEREEERFTATQALEQQRARVRDDPMSFEEAASICRYVRGSAGYGTSPTRFVSVGNPDLFATFERGVVDLPGGMRMTLDLPRECDNVLAYFNAYAKMRAEHELLPRALRRAQSAFPMMQWRQSFGMAIDGYITFFFVGTMGGPNEYYAFAVNTRNWHEWRIVNSRNDFADCIEEALFRVTVDTYPELRGLRRGR